MINYRLSSAVSVFEVRQTSVQTHIHFVKAAFSHFFLVSLFNLCQHLFFASVVSYTFATFNMFYLEKLPRLACHWNSLCYFSRNNFYTDSRTGVIRRRGRSFLLSLSNNQKTEWSLQCVCLHGVEVHQSPLYWFGFPLFPNKYSNSLHILSLSYLVRAEVHGGMLRVQCSRVNSSAVLPQLDFFLALFLCGLHNGQCSVKKDPEGGL